MGNYFVMSTRFNKQTASDFGFVESGKDSAINPIDGTTWIRKSLYDFGWGKENGYYKSPLPNFDMLLNLVLSSADRDDVYGAASIILDLHPYGLLCECEKVMGDKKRLSEFRRLVEVFKLNIAVNRCPIEKKSYHQIKIESDRWKNIAALAKGK